MLPISSRADQRSRRNISSSEDFSRGYGRAGFPGDVGMDEVGSSELVDRSGGGERGTGRFSPVRARGSLRKEARYIDQPSIKAGEVEGEGELTSKPSPLANLS